MLRRLACNRTPTIAPRAASDRARIERLQRLGALAVVVVAVARARPALRVRARRRVPAAGRRRAGSPIRGRSTRRCSSTAGARAGRDLHAARRRSRAAPRGAVLHVEAARAHRVRVNGARLWSSPDPDPAWRTRPQRRRRAQLRAGENEIAIDVWNPRGPPLLRAQLELGGKPVLATDAAWSVVARRRAPQRRPSCADDTRLHPSARGGPASGARAWRAQCAGRCSASSSRRWRCAFGVRRLARARSARGFPALALALVHVGWLALFAAKLVVAAGDDRLRRHPPPRLRRAGCAREHALPLPTTAGRRITRRSTTRSSRAAARLSGGTPRPSAIATKLPSFAAGLGTRVGDLRAGARAARRCGPSWSRSRCSSPACCRSTSTRPPTSRTSRCTRSLFGASAAALRAGAAARRACGSRDAALVGVAVGLALLAKVTALLLAAVAGFFLLARVVQSRGRAAARASPRSARAYVAPIAALGGWFYARNVQLYGTPIVGNWNLPGMRWWSQPGFHTPAYYLGLRRVAAAPGARRLPLLRRRALLELLGRRLDRGPRERARSRPRSGTGTSPRSATGSRCRRRSLLVWGSRACVRLAFAPSEGARRAAWSFLLALVAARSRTALVALTLDLPYFGQAKAPYLLGLVAPLSRRVRARRRRVRSRARAAAAARSPRASGRALWLAIGAVLWLSMAA